MSNPLSNPGTLNLNPDWSEVSESELSYCGCCGAPGASESISDPWCNRCANHVGPRSWRLEDRTYSAMHDSEECPSTIADDEALAVELYGKTRPLNPLGK